MTKQFKDELHDLMRTARKVLDKDLIDLRTDPASTRQNKYDQIQEDKTEFENDFSKKYSGAMQDINQTKFIGEFDTALLYLHVASVEDPSADPLDPSGFTNDEVKALREFDDYRAFDVSDKEDLNQKIKQKDDDIYEFVVKEITQQKEQRGDIFESQHNEIRTSIMDYLGDRYAEREALGREGVGLYIEKHGLPDVIKSIEEAVTATVDAAETRESVQEQVEEIMEDFTGRIMAGLHGQEQSVLAEISALQHELETGGEDISHIENELSNVRNEIDELNSSRRDEISELTDVLENLESKRDELDEKIDELNRKQREATQQAAEIAEETTADKSSQLLEQALEDLQEERASLQAEVDRLEREREKTDSGRQRLEEEYGNLSDRLESLETSVRPDETSESVDAIRAEDARLFELDYIGRIKSSLKNADSISLPNGESFEVTKGYWNNTSHISTGDRRDEMEQLLDGSEEIVKYPLGRYVRATLTESNYLASNNKLIIEAAVLAHLEAYARNEFDTAAAGLSDLLDIVNATMNRADKASVPHIIAVASPTGWTDDVIEMVEKANLSRARFGDNVSIYLIDLEHDTIHYDRADDVLVANESIVTRENKDERVGKCKRKLRSEYIDDTTDAIIMKNVVEQEEYGATVVKEAFESIAQTGNYGLLNTEYGLALDTK